VIALKHKVESNGCAWAQLDGEGQRAIVKGAIGNRGLHLFTTTSAASDLCSILLENQECTVVVSCGVRRWNIKGALPAARNVLEDFGVCSDCEKEENKARQTVAARHMREPLLQSTLIAPNG
jgi:hypothetical protein